MRSNTFVLYGYKRHIPLNLIRPCKNKVNFCLLLLVLLLLLFVLLFAKTGILEKAKLKLSVTLVRDVRDYQTKTADRNYNTISTRIWACFKKIANNSGSSFFFF